MNNTDIRQFAKDSGVAFWQIAKVMGKSEASFTRYMREELSRDQKSEIKEIIRKLKGV